MITKVTVLIYSWYMIYHTVHVGKENERKTNLEGNTAAIFHQSEQGKWRLNGF